jgi:hydrogenase maturation protease
MKSGPSLLVAGIGNIFFGDDAFGCEVANELMRRQVPDGVKVEDFGIRTYDLAYALMDGCDAILVDAVPRGELPGTLYLIKLDLENLGALGHAIPDAHSMTPVSVLEMVKSMGGFTGRLYLIGCEPAVLDSEEGRMGLSEDVQAAVPRAVERIESLIADFLYDKIPRSPGRRLAGAVKEVS